MPRPKAATPSEECTVRPEFRCKVDPGISSYTDVPLSLWGLTTALPGRGNGKKWHIAQPCLLGAAGLLTKALGFRLQKGLCLISHCMQLLGSHKAHYILLAFIDDWTKTIEKLSLSLLLFTISRKLKCDDLKKCVYRSHSANIC